MSNNTFATKSSCSDRHTKEEKKRYKLEDEPFVKDGKLSKKEELLLVIPAKTLHTIRQHAKNKVKSGNNAEASDSASGQAEQVEHVVGQDGLSVAGGQLGCAGFCVGSRSSSHGRWTKRRVQTERLSPQKITATQRSTQPLTHSQVQVTETRKRQMEEKWVMVCQHEV
ncbi:hypothetical protein Tco_0404693 [Tanacetum coccineum]